MKNRAYLDILKQGVEVWNRWRETFPGVIAKTEYDIEKMIGADLTGANLEGLDLQNVNFANVVLSYANFDRANMEGADLSNALLNRARFGFTNLSHVNLTGARLYFADIYRANLKDAIFHKSEFNFARINHVDFSESNLEGVDFNVSELVDVIFTNANLINCNFFEASVINANFTKADLKHAIFSNTKFVSANLNDVQNLTSAKHYSESKLSIDMLGSNPGLPLEFLRGCGLSDVEVEFYKLYNKVLDNSEIADIGGNLIRIRSKQGGQNYSCFISYSSRNEDFARKLYTDLQKSGIRCWLASEDLKIGSKFRYAIDRAIRSQDKLIVVLSESSIESNWVETEVETVLEEEEQRKRVVLLPIRIDDSVLKTARPWARMLRRERHIGDFSNWKLQDDYLREFNRLIKSLKATDPHHS